MDLTEGADVIVHKTEVAGHMLPGGEDDLRDVALAVHHRVRSPDTQQKPAAVVLEDLLIYAGSVVVRLEGHHPGSHLGDGNLRAPVAQGAQVPGA